MTFLVAVHARLVSGTRCALILALLIAGGAVAADAQGQDPHWIWQSDEAQHSIPVGGSTYFRKTFVSRHARQASITIAADDTYELYINGRRVAQGQNSRQMAEYDVSRFMIRGVNVIGVHVKNTEGRTAGLAARLAIHEPNGGTTLHVTDASWKTTERPLPLWNTVLYSDLTWSAAQTSGRVEEMVAAAQGMPTPADPASPTPATQPAESPEPAEAMDDEEPVPATARPEPELASAGSPEPSTEENLAPIVTKTAVEPAPKKEPVPDVPPSERFSVAPDFEVVQVLGSEAAGSLIAMAFNEFGHIIAAREGGELLLIYDSDNNKTLDKTRTYCDKVKNIQGILALNGDVFVTGEGPEGLGLYRLSDRDRDGQLEQVRQLIKIESENLEHGPHGLVLGPDGLIYVLLGNHSKPATDIDPGSPHRDYYEGDLLTPRYEDPGGHAVGVKAPGGCILRTDAEGTGAQIVAGGLRNPYDLCFNRDGELFIHDADMESDEGMTWYRQTRLCQVIPGGEYGWRSGWAKWPNYYVDSLPPILETGRGSPTGIVAYDHFMYPVRYHGAIFTADWSQGRILAVKLKPNGASYAATSEVFLEGNPANVTDMEVGPDGWLYFVTGGRGTSGGVYRVEWKGRVPREVADIGAGLSAVIRQPQMQSAFSRQNIASLRKQMGQSWDKSLLGVAKTSSNPPHYRLQALDLMQLYGPAPTPELLLALSREKDGLVRARAADLMGLYADDELSSRLIELLDDDNAYVRRKACEALSRADRAPTADKLIKLLASEDRFEAWAARRLLERMALDDWRQMVLTTSNHRVLIQGGVALMTAYPEKRQALDLLEKISAEMKTFITDRDFVDMLRVTQIAMLRGEILPEEVPGLRRQLAEEFPSGDPLMNRELIRLLAFMQESTITARYIEYLGSKAEPVDKLHVAMHLRFINDGWSQQQRMQLIEFYEKAQEHKGGGSYARYVINATRDFVKNFSEEDALTVLAKGAEMPNAALGALYRVPAQIDADTLAMLESLDGQLKDKNDESHQRLKVGIVAVLARSGDPESMAYLRQIWEADPERRQAVALGLAQQPDGENWAYLIRTLPHLEHKAARDLFKRLATVPQAPEEPEPYRQVIVLGLKMKEKGSEPAVQLLQFWTGEQLAADQSVDKQMEAWQTWFSQKFPDQPEATLPKVSETAKYTFEQLTEHLASDKAKEASATRGMAVFSKAQCAKCHRFGERGDSIGPDLTTVSSRFTRRELLESIVYPSHVISSQYASKTILTADGKTVTGIVAPGAGGETVVLSADGKKTVLQEDEIEDIQPSKVSSMPSGLLDELTLEEIADLFALLQGTGKTNLARQPAVREAIR